MWATLNTLWFVACSSVCVFPLTYAVTKQYGEQDRQADCTEGGTSERRKTRRILMLNLLPFFFFFSGEETKTVYNTSLALFELSHQKCPQQSWKGLWYKLNVRLVDLRSDYF